MLQVYLTGGGGAKASPRQVLDLDPEDAVVERLPRRLGDLHDALTTDSRSHFRRAGS